MLQLPSPCSGVWRLWAGADAHAADGVCEAGGLPGPRRASALRPLNTRARRRHPPNSGPTLLLPMAGPQLPYIGLVDADARNIMYGFALFFGGLVRLPSLPLPPPPAQPPLRFLPLPRPTAGVQGQLVCGVLEYSRKNTFACVTWLCFSGTCQRWPGRHAASRLLPAACCLPEVLHCCCAARLLDGHRSDWHPGGGRGAAALAHRGRCRRESAQRLGCLRCRRR